MRKGLLSLSLVLFLLTIIAPGSLALSTIEDSFISQDLLFIARNLGNRLSFTYTDLFGLDIPRNQVSLKIGLGRVGMLLELSDLQNEIDLIYKERAGSFTTAIEISDKLTIGSRIRLSQIDTVVTGSGWGLDLGFIYSPTPKLELALGLDNLIGQKQFSTETVEQAKIGINTQARLNLGSGFSLLCGLAEEDYTIGIEQQLSNKVALSANASHSGLEGAFSLLQNKMGLNY